VSRGCFGEFPDECQDKQQGDVVGVKCGCKADLCNTGVHQSFGHEIIVGCVIITAIVGHIFYY